jgi:hypothetical protein
MATMTRLSLTLDPMGISHFHLFFLKPQNRFEPNLARYNILHVMIQCMSPILYIYHMSFCPSETVGHTGPCFTKQCSAT